MMVTSPKHSYLVLGRKLGNYMTFNGIHLFSRNEDFGETHQKSHFLLILAIWTLYRTNLHPVKLKKCHLISAIWVFFGQALSSRCHENAIRSQLSVFSNKKIYNINKIQNLIADS